MPRIPTPAQQAGRRWEILDAPLLLLLLAIILSGCQTLDLDLLPAAITPQPTPAVDPQSSPTPATAENSAGQLAYIGNDGNVYVTDAAGSAPVAVTDDATTFPEGTGLSYHRVSWSRDGWLAIAAVNRVSNSQASSKLYVTNAPGEPLQLVGQSDENFVIYMHWSPAPCLAQPACKRLGYLIEDDDDISLRLVDINGSQVDNRRVGLGGPFYFSWHPNGRQLVWHTGGARRYNSNAQLALYNVEQERVQPLPLAPGLFLAPAWSPQGERWLGVTANNAVDRLQSFGAEQQVDTLIETPDKQLVFSWSPGGDRIAYAVRKSNADPFYGPIHIFNVKTGQTRQLTDSSLNILGFFWAPEGQRMGYLIRQALPESTWMQWRVYDLAQNKDRGFKAFQPSSQIQFVIGSFNQYAQSHRFWSPDGRYLVYADRDETRVERVWLIDTWHQDGRNVIPVGRGTIGFWSWN